MRVRALRAHTTDRNSGFGQTLIGIVRAQLQTILGARSKHAIRLADTTRDEIINHHAKIGLRAIDDDFRALACESRSIETSKKPLCRGFFVSCGAIDLTRQEQPAQSFGLQRRRKLAWI